MSLTDSPHAQRRVLNPLAALIVAVVGCAGWYGLNKLHAIQLGRTQEFLKVSAYSSLQKQEHREARKRLMQYLAMKPRDLEAREKLSELLTKHVGTPAALEQAFSLNEDLLRAGHGSPDLRLTQAGIAVRLGLFVDAEAHLKPLRTAMPDASTVWLLSGKVALAARDTDSAKDWFRKATQCSSPEPEAFVELAVLMAAETDADAEVESVLSEMVQRCPRAEALDLRSSWSLRHGHTQQALADLQELLLSDPDNPRLNALQVRCLQEQALRAQSGGAVSPEIENAVRRLRAGISRSPSASANPLRMCLTALLWSTNQQAEAIRVLEDGIRVSPGEWSLQQTLIEYLCASGDRVRARRVLEQIPANGLSRAASLFCTGRVQMAEGNWAEAGKTLEQSLAYASPRTDLFHRIQLSLAICRGRNGEGERAVEVFRNVVESQPDSLPARLGIAAARVQSGQLDLAIAEYRQLISSPGVPACLADLLIRRMLELPPAVRDWAEVDRLTRDDDPLIPDPVERTLLRADRLFAEGRIADATVELELGVQDHPGRHELTSALRRLHGTNAAELNSRLRQLVQENPANPDTLAALVRFQLTSSDPDKAWLVLEQAANTGTGQQGRGQSLGVAVAALRIVIRLERLVGRTGHLPELQRRGLELAAVLSSIDPRGSVELAAWLSESGRTADAMSALQSLNSKPAWLTLHAEGLLQIVRESPEREAAARMVLPVLYELIRRNPDETALRLTYADVLLMMRDHRNALATLEPISELATVSQAVNLRRAWIRAVFQGLPDSSSQLEQAAARGSADLPMIREVQARVALVAGDHKRAAELVRLIPESQRSASARVCLAAALVELRQTSDARAELRRIAILNGRAELFPPDLDLLQDVTRRVGDSVTVSSSAL